MRPLKLTMQAFGPYLEKHTLDFGPGSEEAPLLICGPGGSGKSYLIKAIIFALFGLTGLANNQKLHGIRNIEAGLELPTKVTLNFQSGDQQYRVERRLETKEDALHTCSPDCQAILKALDNEEYLALGECEVNSIIEKILGLASSDYINLALPSPDNTNPVISIEQGVNKAFLQRIFQADDLDNIWPEILRQSSVFLQQISRDNLSFIMPEPGSAVFQDDYYTLTLKDNLGSIKNPPQTLSAGARAIILASLHLGIIKAQQRYSGTNQITCLFLDHFLERLDQVSLEKFTAGLHEQELKGTQLI